MLVAVTMQSLGDLAATAGVSGVAVAVLGYVVVRVVDNGLTGVRDDVRALRKAVDGYRDEVADVRERVATLEGQSGPTRRAEV